MVKTTIKLPFEPRNLSQVRAALLEYEAREAALAAAQKAREAQQASALEAAHAPKRNRGGWLVVWDALVVDRNLWRLHDYKPYMMVSILSIIIGMIIVIYSILNFW